MNSEETLQGVDVAGILKYTMPVPGQHIEWVVEGSELRLKWRDDKYVVNLTIARVKEQDRERSV